MTVSGRYPAWRFGPDGKCDDIPYHQGTIPATACVKSWTVVESLVQCWTLDGTNKTDGFLVWARRKPER